MALAGVHALPNRRARRAAAAVRWGLAAVAAVVALVYAGGCFVCSDFVGGYVFSGEIVSAVDGTPLGNETIRIDPPIGVQASGATDEPGAFEVFGFTGHAGGCYPAVTVGGRLIEWLGPPSWPPPDELDSAVLTVMWDGVEYTKELAVTAAQQANTASATRYVVLGRIEVEVAVDGGS